jgi:AbrB family looped-hinge helix DNA binding protein
MRITSKGQVTIPQQVRLCLGLLPHTEVEFELADDHAIIRNVHRNKGLGARGQSVLSALSNAADARMSTDEIMVMTRGGSRGGRKTK